MSGTNKRKRMNLEGLAEMSGMFNLRILKRYNRPLIITLEVFVNFVETQQASTQKPIIEVN